MMSESPVANDPTTFDFEEWFHNRELAAMGFYDWLPGDEFGYLTWPTAESDDSDQFDIFGASVSESETARKRTTRTLPVGRPHAQVHSKRSRARRRPRCSSGSTIVPVTVGQNVAGDGETARHATW